MWGTLEEAGESWGCVHIVKTDVLLSEATKVLEYLEVLSRVIRVTERKAGLSHQVPDL